MDIDCQQSMIYHLTRELTTHPEPCKAAPSAFIFCIKVSKEPKLLSIAQPKEPLGGSPPPSCKEILDFYPKLPKIGW